MGFCVSGERGAGEGGEQSCGCCCVPMASALPSPFHRRIMYMFSEPFTGAMVWRFLVDASAELFPPFPVFCLITDSKYNMGPPELSTGTCSRLNGASSDPSFCCNSSKFAVHYPTDLCVINPEDEEGPALLPPARCVSVAVEAGCLSQRFVDLDSFVLPQQPNAALRRVRDLWKLHPASGAALCQTWLFWSTLARSSG